jgi:hypothetical protein
MTIRGQQKALFNPAAARVAGRTSPPLYIFEDGSFGYLVRYRIVSEDNNRYSSWSNIYKVEAPEPPNVFGEVLVSENIVQIVWDDIQSRPQYDIFVSFDGGEYGYHGTSPIHSYSLLNDVGATSIDIAIQIESVQKEYFEPLIICEILYEEES